MFYYKNIAAGMLEFEHPVENNEQSRRASFGYRALAKARYKARVTR